MQETKNNDFKIYTHENQRKHFTMINTKIYLFYREQK